MKIKEETCNLAIPVVNRATAHFHYVSPVANRFSSDFTDFFCWFRFANGISMKKKSLIFIRFFRMVVARFTGFRRTKTSSVRLWHSGRLPSFTGFFFQTWTVFSSGWIDLSTFPFILPFRCHCSVLRGGVQKKRKEKRTSLPSFTGFSVDRAWKVRRCEEKGKVNLIAAPKLRPRRWLETKKERATTNKRQQQQKQNTNGKRRPFNSLKKWFRRWHNGESVFRSPQSEVRHFPLIIFLFVFLGQKKSPSAPLNRHSMASSVLAPFSQGEIVPFGF